MLIPDIDPAGRIVFVDYRPSHPRHAMLSLAAGGTCLLEVNRKGHRFEATITGLDTTIVDRQLQADLMGAQRWLEARAGEYLREVRRLDIARRLLACVGEDLTVIKADFEQHRLRPFMPPALVDRRLPETHRR